MQNAGVIGAAGISIAGVPLSAGFVHTLMAIGTGVNVGALSIYLLGLLAKPYDWVVTPSIRDIPVPRMGGWFHFGRNSTPLNAYRVAAGAPTGLRWGCGGLTPIIVNRVLTGFASSLASSPTPFQPNELVIWGLLPLADDPSTIPSTFGSSVSGIDTEWNGKNWDELTDEEQALWRRLGWSEELWGSDASPAPGSKRWAELTDDERRAATDLGYDETTWNGLEFDGMLVVAGSRSYNPGIALALARQGVTQAIATDGHLSPLLGTHGDLLFETNFMLDPIQKYGFMAIPE